MSVIKSLVNVSALVMAFAALMTPTIAVSQNVVFYTIVVKGGTDGENGLIRLQRFYSNLLTELQVEDLGEANIGCNECGDLDKEPAETELTFAVEPDGLNVLAFAESYHRVQANAETRATDFSLTIDGTPPPLEGECPVTPLPKCMPRPICIQTGSCDRPYGGACVKCVP